MKYFSTNYTLYRHQSVFSCHHCNQALGDYILFVQLYKHLYHFFLSCHYTNSIHCLTQSFAVSLYTIRSLIEHVCCNSRHPRRSVFLHSHVVSSFSLNFHFFMLCLLRPIVVRSLLRHFHSNQVPDAPLVKDSQDICISLLYTDCRWLDHSLIRRVDGISISLSVSCMKLLLDGIRLFGTMWCLNTSPYGRGSETD